MNGKNARMICIILSMFHFTYLGSTIINSPISIYIKNQPKTVDLSTRLVGITTEFVGFIPTSLVLRSIVLG